MINISCDQLIDIAAIIVPALVTVFGFIGKEVIVYVC